MSQRPQSKFHGDEGDESNDGDSFPIFVIPDGCKSIRDPCREGAARYLLLIELAQLLLHGMGPRVMPEDDGGIECVAGKGWCDVEALPPPCGEG